MSRLNFEDERINFTPLILYVDYIHILHREYLIENYEKVWVDLDPYLREALFHIIFLRIHPYEDGNGRIARIITSYNLMKLGLAPAIITPHEKNDYNNCIENYEPEVLAEMIRNLSNDESLAIKQLYNKYYPDDYAKILSRQS